MVSLLEQLDFEVFVSRTLSFYKLFKTDQAYSCILGAFEAIFIYSFQFQHASYSLNGLSCRPRACNFIKKETQSHVFSCEFCEIS